MKTKKILIKAFFALFCLLVLFSSNLSADDSMSTFNRAERLFSEKQYMPALKLYEQTVNTDPGFILAYQGIVKTYQALGDEQGALIYMETLFMEKPESSGVYYGLGYAQYSAKQYSQAKTSFKKAIELDTELSAAHNNVAAIYHFIEQDFDNARLHYEKAIELSRKKGNQRVLEIAQKNLSNLPQKETFEPVTETLSLDEFINMFIGLVENKDEQTIKSLVAGQQENCEKAFDWFISQALISFDSADINRENTMAMLAALVEQYYTRIHKIHSLEGRLEKHRKLEDEVKKSAAKAEVLLKEALQKQQSNMHPDAIELLKKALKIFEQIGDREKKAQTLMLMGNCQRISQDYSSAQISYQQALSLFIENRDEPSQALTLYLLGTTCYRLGNTEEAVELLTRALLIYNSLGDSKTAQQIEKDLKRIDK